MWTARFGRGFGPVIRQTTKWMNGNYTQNFKTSRVQKHTGLKISNTLALSTLLYGYKTWAIREQYKSRIMPAEMKRMRWMAKYKWQFHKTKEDILSELKINPGVKKTQNYRNKWTQHVQWVQKDYPSKGFYLLMGMEQVMGPKSLQATWWWWWWC